MLFRSIKLSDLYSKLIQYPTKNVMVFLDACFSGGARNLGLVTARGVKIKPKEEILSGNLIVFSASTGEQSSFPYKEKKHGLFTYYLLKKIQTSNGETTLGELYDYILKEVSLKSVLVNNKEQNPQINTSFQIQNTWRSIKLK